MWIISFGFMGICTIWDLIRKEIPVLVLILFTTAAGMYTLLLQWTGVYDFLISIVPGCFFLFISKVSGEAIGYGDGWMMISLGLLLGYQRLLVVIMTAVMVSSFFSIILLILKRADRKSRIAFAPFLAAGMGIAYVL